MMSPRRETERAAWINHNVTERQRVRFLVCDRTSCPPEQRVHALQQLNETEWFRDVLIGVEPEAADLVLLLAARGQDQHRDLVTVAADSSKHLEAIAAPATSGRG